MTKVKLGDVFESQITGEWGQECEDSNGVKVIRTTNFTSIGIIDYENVVIRDIEEKKVNAKRLLTGDIILEKSGGTDKTPVGRVVYCDRKIEEDIFLCNNFTQAMRTNTNVAVSKYIFYLMWYFHLIGKTDLMQNKTTGIRNLQVKTYLNQLVDLPSLSEQQQIADTLDKVSDLIAKRKQQLEKLDLLVKSRFSELDENAYYIAECKLKDITSRVKVGFVGTCEKYYTDNKGIPMLRTTNITDVGIDYSNMKYVTTEFHNKNKKSQVHSGDLLIARHGSNGRACVYVGEDAQCLNAVIIEPNYNYTNSIYLEYLINSDYIKRQVLKNLVGSTQHVINTTSLANVVCKIWNVKLQNQFADFVTATEQQKEKVQKSLETLETLKASLMQKYFG